MKRGEHTLPIKASDIGLPDDADAYACGDDETPYETFDEALGEYFFEECEPENPEICFEAHALKEVIGDDYEVVATVKVRASIKIERVKP